MLSMAVLPRDGGKGVARVAARAARLFRGAMERRGEDAVELLCDLVRDRVRLSRGQRAAGGHGWTCGTLDALEWALGIEW